MLKRNLIANYLGQAWSSLINFAFVPVYVHYLGIESYALIGLFAVLQAGLNVLDMGMTPTLGREMARFQGGQHTPESIRSLLRTIEVIAIAVSLLFFLLVFACAPWIADDWIQETELPAERVVTAFRLMGLVGSLRFIEGLYKSSLSGLQFQVQLNAITSSFNTIRGLGAVVVLLTLSPTIEAFFIWQASISVVEFGIVAWFTYSHLPVATVHATFSLSSLTSVWRFATGVTAISVLTFLLMQIDKLILARMLPLSEYGLYTFAATAAGAVLTLGMPVLSAIYPRLTQQAASKDASSFAETYHLGAQVISVVVGSAAIVMFFWCDAFLLLWTQKTQLSVDSSQLVRILVFGNLLNAFMWMPYHAQLAHGWTRLTITLNIIMSIVLVPSLILLIPHFGAIGAASAWCLLNATYIAVGTTLMHQRILTSERMRWYSQDLLRPLVPVVIVVCVHRLALGGAVNHNYSRALAILSAACLALWLSMRNANLIRPKLQVVLRDRGLARLSQLV